MIRAEKSALFSFGKHIQPDSSGGMCFLLIRYKRMKDGCTQYLLCLNRKNQRNDRIKDNSSTSKFIIPPNTLR